MKVYNNERPQQGIANKYPAQIYRASTRIYDGMPEVEYPFADKTVTITQFGRICMGGKKNNVTSVLGGKM